MQQTKTKAEKAKKKLTEAKATEEAERVAFCKAEVIGMLFLVAVGLVVILVVGGGGRWWWGW